MYTKAIFIIIDVLAVIELYFVIRSLGKMTELFASWLKYALVSSVIAIVANILIAISFDAMFANVAYALYYGSIDWIIFYLGGFCLEYTEHSKLLSKCKVPVAIIMLADTLLLLSNPVFGNSYSIYTKENSAGFLFYQAESKALFNVHLFLCYVILFLALVFLIVKIVMTFSFYQTKYILILMDVVFVVVLNVFYMMLGLLLDASVIFYGVAGSFIYYCIKFLVPQRLMNVAVVSATDDMNEGLILFDIYDNCIYANSFAKERFLSEGKEFSFSNEPIATVMKDVGETETGFGHTEYRQTEYRDGIPVSRTYRVKYNELTDDKGHTIGSYFLFEDTTEENYYLEEIKAARVKADNANIAKSTFLASMSHEIRTPLNSVLGMNEMILRSTTDTQLLEYAENIKSSGDILLSLINDILDFSKIEAGKMELIYAAYSPHKILKDCHTAFSQMAEGKSLFFNIECDEKMPSLLQGDERRLRQIFSNIISNAIKYTKMGGVTVSLHSEDLDDDNVWMVARIQDTGIGIAEEDIQYLFDSFRRVNEEQNATIQGTGLGLSITKELIELMKGTIEVSSTVGRGSSFTIRIPQRIMSFSAIGKFKLHEEVSEHKYKETFKAPSANILVVDDVAVNLKVVEALLRRTEVKLDKATGGLEAIDKCNEKKYDLILLDHRMPDPDGVETFKRIKAEGLNLDTPVIVLTANALSGAEEEYRQIGFADYLSKPIKSNELELAILRNLPIEKVEII
ncbi:MAG: response regulator [Lachnospiraceae bacterium]|nr:response regulator [Lachnospiraceae bacterium]